MSVVGAQYKRPVQAPGDQRSAVPGGDA